MLLIFGPMLKKLKYMEENYLLKGLNYKHRIQMQTPLRKCTKLKVSEE